jgi:hypothetical protein
MRKYIMWFLVIISSCCGFILFLKLIIVEFSFGDFILLMLLIAGAILNGQNLAEYYRNNEPS